MIPKIAVVEDHSFFRKGICLALKKFKFVEIGFEAGNGLEFLEKQRINPSDIVLLDVLMPEMDGYETLKKIQQEFPDLKVIILTRLDNDEAIQKIY